MKDELPRCDKCDHSYMGYFESSTNYSLKCSMYDSECSEQCKRGCNSFENKASEIINLKKQLETEKAKVEKLKKCVKHYASLEHNSEAQSLEYDEPSFFFDGDDISTEIWHGKDHNGVERSHKGRYYGKLARLTLKEIGE